MAPRFQRPVGSRVTGTFLSHVKRRSVNAGVDYGAPIGTPVYAPESGIVVVVDRGASGAGGISLCINFDNGWGCDLLHLSSIPSSIKVGTRVKRGQVVARSGCTANGYTTPGPAPRVFPHLHLSLRPNHAHYYNAANVDAERYIGRAIAPRDPDPRNEVYRDKASGIKLPRYYRVGVKGRTNTRIKWLWRRWIKAHGYGGELLRADIFAREAALLAKYNA